MEDWCECGYGGNWSYGDVNFDFGWNEFVLFLNVECGCEWWVVIVEVECGLFYCI